MPKTAYLIGHPPVLITPQSPQWRQALPVRHSSTSKGPGASGANTSYGAYFKAASAFLSKNRRGLLVQAARRTQAPRIAVEDIDSVSIHLVKHGAFYHPSKVSLHAGDKQLHAALNVAVSKEGRAILEHEYECLKRLNRHSPHAYLPAVLGCERNKTAAPGNPLMFAAQWFDGYSEFHLSNAAPGGPSQWVLWDETGDHRLLSRQETHSLYQKATQILTTYYNPLTFEAIQQWHHAAGDFVVRPDGDNTQVRLITARHYAPVVEIDAKDLSLQSILDGFVLFFVSTSLRMRLDRVDGVGEATVAPCWVLGPVWSGFVLALDDAISAAGLPEDLKQGVVDYLGAHSPAEFCQIGLEMAARYPRGAREAELIRQHIDGHAAALAATINCSGRIA